MVHINLIGWLAVTSTVFSSVVVAGAEEVPQITRDINKNDARRLYNGGDGGGEDEALREVDIPDECFRDVLWTEEQCRDWVEGNNVPGVTIFAGSENRSPVKGCFYSVPFGEAYWGTYPLNPANDDYLTRVGEDFNNGRRVRIFCNNNVVPTSSPTEVPTTVEPTTPEPTDEPTSLEPTLSPPPTDTLTPDPTTPSPTTDEPTTTPPSPWPTEMATDEGTDCDDDDDDKWGGGKGWGCDKHHDDDDDDWSGSSSGSSGWKNSGRSHSSGGKWKNSRSHSSGGKWKHSRSGGSKARKRRSEWRRSGGRRSSSWSSVSNDGGGKSNWRRSSNSKNNSGWRRPRWGSLRQAEFDIATCHGSKSEEKTSKECKEVTVDGACIERCTLTINHKCNGETMNLETITTDDRKSDTPC